MMSRIVFDSPHVSLIHNAQNGSGTLIITFGDMLALADGDAAWGEKPVTNGGYDILSFMSKQRDWFPHIRISPALDTARNLAKRYDRVVLYGGSMGGYAALKYSATLGADGVIAFVPQHSIDPVDITDKRYNKYFEPDVHIDMALKPSDICGRVLILNDATFPPDEAHMKKIQQASPAVSRLSLWGTEHKATALLASSSYFADLIDHLAGTTSRAELVRNARSQMKKRFMYHKLIVRQLEIRRPQTAERLYEVATLKDPEDRTDFERAIIAEREKDQA